MLRQAGGLDRLGGALDVVVDPVVGGRPGVGVELEPGGARVAVAGLADAARVDQPAALGDLERGAGAAWRRARPRASRPSAALVGKREEQGDVGMADEG